MRATTFITSLQAVLPSVKTASGDIGWVLSRDEELKQLVVLLVTGAKAGRCSLLNYRSVTLCADYLHSQRPA